MVEYSSARLDTVFHALADPTRRAMLRHLTRGERTISELADPFDMSLAGASKHVQVLEAAGLLRRRVHGRTHRCRLDVTGLAEAYRWIGFYERFWNTQLDKLEALLRADDAGAGASTGKRRRK
jgi:DNA-binding transcriptional ArsR family regulator